MTYTYFEATLSQHRSGRAWFELDVLGGDGQSTLKSWPLLSHKMNKAAQSHIVSYLLLYHSVPPLELQFLTIPLALIVIHLHLSRHIYAFLLFSCTSPYIQDIFLVWGNNWDISSAFVNTWKLEMRKQFHNKLDIPSVPSSSEFALIATQTLSGFQVPVCQFQFLSFL